MKCIISLILLIIFLVGLSSCTASQEGLEQTQDLSKTVQMNSLENIPMKQDDGILSKDYAIAEKALVKAILEKDKKTIKLGLKSQFFPIKQKTVKAITEIKDKTFVLDLIIALHGNQSIFTGGTETEVMRNDLNKVVVFALEQLTGLRFHSSENLSPEDIQKILKKSREWWEINQGKDK
jgi:hypothetical protein